MKIYYESNNGHMFDDLQDCLTYEKIVQKMKEKNNNYNITSYEEITLLDVLRFSSFSYKLQGLTKESQEQIKNFCYKKINNTNILNILNIKSQKKINTLDLLIKLDFCEPIEEYNFNKNELIEFFNIDEKDITTLKRLHLFSD